MGHLMWNRMMLGKGVSRALATLIVAAACLAAPAAVHAQKQPPVAHIAAAREAFVAGVEAAQAGQWEEARVNFERSYSFYPRPATLLNLAGAQAQTGKLLEAGESYRRYLRSEAKADPQIQAEAERALAAVEARIPHVRVSRGRGLLPDDTLVLDGAILPAVLAATSLPLDPGAHRLAAVRGGVEVEGSVQGGVEVAKADFSVADGQLIAVSLDAPAPASSAPPGAAAPSTLTPSTLMPSTPTPSTPASSPPTSSTTAAATTTAATTAAATTTAATTTAATTTAATTAAAATRKATRADLASLHPKLLLRAGAPVSADDPATSFKAAGGADLRLQFLPIDFAPVRIWFTGGIGGTIGAWRRALLVSSELDLGAMAELGPLNATVAYSPTVLSAEGRRDISLLAYRATIGYRLRWMELGLSWQEAGRGANSTLRLLTAYLVIEL